MRLVTVDYSSFSLLEKLLISLRHSSGLLQILIEMIHDSIAIDHLYAQFSGAQEQLLSLREILQFADSLHFLSHLSLLTDDGRKVEALRNLKSYSVTDAFCTEEIVESELWILQSIKVFTIQFLSLILDTSRLQSSAVSLDAVQDV